jgi:uncharacterized LabA/DUF88 family protein
MPEITNVYVDAFNLYYGSLKGTAYKWLDLRRFCELTFPPPRNQINTIRYFTARVKARPSDPGQPQRQEVYLRALRTLPNVTVHFGHYLESTVRMRLAAPPAGGPSTVEVIKTEEKGSDVNIASHLLLDAFRGRYDVAVVISNDSDLAEPIHLVRTELRRKVLVLMPCCNGGTPSIKLRTVASKALRVDPAHLAAAQFPGSLTDAAGAIITKPASW